MISRMLVIKVQLSQVLAATVAVLAVSGLTSFAHAQGGAAKVQNVGFSYAPGKSVIEINFDTAVSVDKKVNEADRQVVLEFGGASINKKWARRIDTSQHPSNIALISPYQEGKNVRVVLQMKEASDVEVSQEGGKVKVLVDNKQPDAQTPPQAESPADTQADTQADTKTADASPVPASDVPADPTVPPAQPELATPASPTPPASNDPLDTFLTAHQTKEFTGKKIVLNLQEAELSDVFRVISEASEFNIVVSDHVKGKISMVLNDVPWDQALDVVLQSYRLSAERRGSVLRITTTEQMIAEKEAIIAAKKAETAAEPIVVKIFPISYAKLADLKTIVQDFLSPASSGLATSGRGAAGSLSNLSSSSGSSVQADNRTNSLIIRDTASNIEKIRRIVAELDTPTPQVLIEAKFVEVSEDNVKTVQGRIFSTSREFSGSTLAFPGAKNNFGALFGGTAFNADNGLQSTFSITPPAGGASFGFAPRTGLIPGIGEIGAFLSILETESSAKVIASPRVVTQNREAAEISQGKTLQIPTPVGANATGGYQQVNVVLKLNVTPQITNDGSVSMKITFSQDNLSAQQLGGGTLSTDTKKVDTSVLVESGGTLVIGGIYTSTENESSAGIPILRDLPIIGALFGSRDKKLQKGELFIFLTPRVINDKEAGVKG